MWHSTMSVLTWKPKVTPRNRLLFQLAVSKHPTKETESGSSQSLWPTPTTQEIEHPDAQLTETGRRLSKDGKNSHSLGLADQVKMWPTPNSRDWKDSMGTVPPSVGKTRGHSLGQKVAAEQKKMFPTPAARDYKDTGENTDYEKLAKKSKLAGAVKSEMYPTPRSSIGMSMTMDTVVKAMDNNDRGYKGNLEERVAIEQKMWPTPNASDNRDRGNMSDPAIQRRIAKGKQVGLTMAVKDKPGKGTLNPEWVEWLMGYPPGWTDITDSSESPTSQE